MTGSQSGALAQNPRTLAPSEDEVKLTLPETTMFIVGASGVLWALLFGAFNAVFN